MTEVNKTLQTEKGSVPILDGRVFVVGGGTTGLGLSGAKACVAAGARVVVVGRKSESVRAALAELGDHGRGVEGDATLPGTAEKAIETAIRELGRFDGLYHVAGGSGRSLGDGPLDQITDEGWRGTLEWNLTSLFLSNRAAVRQLLKSGTQGSILNMGSVLGFSPAPRYFATHAYAAAKSAAIGLTRASAAHYAKHGIRFNLVAPALVETPMAKRASSNKEMLDYIATKQPLDGGRIGRPEDLDAAVVYLLSDSARFVTGQVLAVDGGWSVSEGQYPT